MKNNIRTIAGILISIVFIYLAAKDVNVDQLLSGIRNSSPLFLVLGTVVFIIAYLLKAQRWLLILKPHDKRYSINNTYPPFFIGFAANNFLPLRIGELVRIYLFARSTESKISFSFSSVFLDRILDGLVLLCLLGFTSFFVIMIDWIQSVIVVAAIIFVGGISISIFIGRSGNVRLGNFIKRDSSLIRKIDMELGNVRDAFKIFNNWKRLLIVLLFSFAVWLFEGLMYLLFAIGLGFDISFLHSVFTMCIVNFGILVPASPGYVGTFEFFCIKSLGLFGITNDQALTFAILIHFSQFIALTIMGIISINYMGINWKNVKAISKKRIS